MADYYENSPAKARADEAVLIDATDVDALVDYCKRNSIDGVTTGFVDILMPVCFEVCKRLGLPYYATEKMISMSTNKIDFKKTCLEHGVPVPCTHYLGSDISEALEAGFDYPVFVKPLDASGSRGAGVCRDEQELRIQFADAMSYSASGKAMVEDYVQGREFLLDYVGVDGEFRLLSMFDRHMCDDRGSAVNYSNASIAPSAAIDRYYGQVDGKVTKMFKDLGFTDGLIFLQGHVHGDEITFYEMGCRLGGSFYYLEDACIGLNPVDMVVRYALSGKMLDSIEAVPPRAARFERRALVCNYLLKGEGETIARIDGAEEVRALDSFVGMVQQRGVGCRFGADRTVDKPAACIYLASDSLDGLLSDFSRVNELFRVSNEEGKSLLMKKLDAEELRRRLEERP